MLAGKHLDLTALVLQNPALDAVAHANVQSATTAADDIGEIVTFLRKTCHPERREGFAKRSIHGVEGPHASMQQNCRSKAFSLRSVQSIVRIPCGVRAVYDGHGVLRCAQSLP